MKAWRQQAAPTLNGDQMRKRALLGIACFVLIADVVAALLLANEWLFCACMTAAATNERLKELQQRGRVIEWELLGVFVIAGVSSWALWNLRKRPSTTMIQVRMIK